MAYVLFPGITGHILYYDHAGNILTNLLRIGILLLTRNALINCYSKVQATAE